jgi:hypothetical protein
MKKYLSTLLVPKRHLPVLPATGMRGRRPFAIRSIWNVRGGDFQGTCEISKIVILFYAVASLFQIRPSNLNRSFATILLSFFLLAVLSGCATKSAIVDTRKAAPASAVIHSEQIRTDCINGRRLICGKVLKIVPDGLVVDSGYTDLLRQPLTRSWRASSTVTASRNSATLELQESGTPCIGLVFLTNIPKKPKVKIFDYVIIMGYPAGQYVYTPLPNVEKTIRKFSASLDAAIKLNLQAGKNASQTNLISPGFPLHSEFLSIISVK